MDWILSGIHQLSGFLRPHLSGIGVVLISMLLVLYGAEINKLVKHLVRRWHWLLRYCAFIALCSVGYGMLLLLLAPFVSQQLASLSSHWLAPVVVTLFVAIGILAERKNQL